MSDSKRNIAPWDEGFYQTGTLVPPRRRGGLVMLLLVLVVLLGGIITIMGLLNIRLFVALKRQEKNALQLQNVQSTATEPTVAPDKPDFSMDLMTQPENDRSEPPTPQEIYAGCIDAVVSVRCGDAEGTGVVVDAAGYIVTNSHAIADAEEIRVLLSDRRQYVARLVGSDSMSDLAVLRIEAEGLTPAVFGDSNLLQVGDAVCTMGDPLGTQNSGTMTNGTVSEIKKGDLPAIRTDALSGSSGPLLDRFGQVIGISTNLGHAIPSTAVKAVVEQLICQGFVSGRPSLGILCEPMSEWHQHYYDLPAGLYVTEVITNAAGEVLKNGDILLMVDGCLVTDSEELSELICSYKSGDQATVTILRDGARLTLTITIEEAHG